VTIRNLPAIFAPQSVAVIGATERPGSIGRVLMENLVGAGFTGRILPVNPQRATVLGLAAYPDVASLPIAADLAVIATPAATVPALVGELAARGTRGAVIISAGFGAHGRALERAVLDAARPALLRIVGPNTLGIAVPQIGLNASFAHLAPARGDLAFLAQSGAIATSVLDWAFARGIGFSHLVALGDMADVDFGDLLDYLANDAGTRAILLYVEAVRSARKFMSAARAAARMKPVIVVKGGRHAQSATAAASHTGRLAGPDAEYDTAFRRAGMLRVATLHELFDAVETLARARVPRGRRLAIVTNGGGLGVLAADALLEQGGELAALGAATIEQLGAFLPAAWSHGNPVDIVGDATPERYAQALDLVLRDPACDAALVLHCPTAISTGLDTARAVALAVARHPQSTVLTSWLGEHTARISRAELEQQRIPTYGTPEEAVNAFMQMVDYRHNQELLLQTPPSLPELFSPDTAAVRQVVEPAARERREWLTDAEARAVLRAYGVPVVVPVVVASPQEAAAAAARIGGPVALKIVASGGLHKSDVGGVILNLSGARAVEAAASAMLERVRSARPELVLHGFTVEPMVETANGLELIIGATSGGDFGPVILFGEGGTAVEVTADTAMQLPPLNLRLAHELIARTRVARKMRGYRNKPAVDVGAVALTLTRIAQLVIDTPELLEIDINPLLATPAGLCALDARIKIAPEGAAPRAPLAIRPYPKELEERVVLADGRTFVLRPILPEDEPALLAGFARLSAEEIRARFFVPMKTLPHLTAARFTQIDYDREMALVLADAGVPGKADIHAVVRLIADPDNRSAEFAIIVEGGLTGLGLGTLLMRKLIDYGRSRGLQELVAEVLADNAAMRSLARSLGFTETPLAADARVVRVALALDSA
jgi:acetyltransferase